MSEQKVKYAATYKYGNTTVHIDDTYVARSPEAIKKVDDEIRSAVLRIHQNSIYKEPTSNDASNIQP